MLEHGERVLQARLRHLVVGLVEDCVVRLVMLGHLMQRGPSELEELSRSQLCVEVGNLRVDRRELGLVVVVGDAVERGGVADDGVVGITPGDC